MSIPSHRHSRRHRRDRTAARVGLMIVCVMVLLTVGGIWYLVGAETGARQPSTIGPLFVLETSRAPNPLAPQERVGVRAIDSRDLSANESLSPSDTPSPGPSGRPLPEGEVMQSAPAPEPVVEVAVPLKPAGPMFDGRPIRAVRPIRMLVTAYSPDARSCGQFADGITASGYSVWTNAMKLVAADKNLFKFGTILTIPGYNDGHPVPVLDRGGKIKGNRLDVLYPTHNIARQWGAQWLNVTVWEYAD